MIRHLATGIVAIALAVTGGAGVAGASDPTTSHSAKFELVMNPRTGEVDAIRGAKHIWGFGRHSTHTFTVTANGKKALFTAGPGDKTTFTATCHPSHGLLDCFFAPNK